MHGDLAMAMLLTSCTLTHCQSDAEVSKEHTHHPCPAVVTRMAIIFYPGKTFFSLSLSLWFNQFSLDLFLFPALFPLVSCLFSLSIFFLLCESRAERMNVPRARYTLTFSLPFIPSYRINWLSERLALVCQYQLFPCSTFQHWVAA